MLPIFTTPIRELSMMQTQWATPLNVLLQNPILQGLQLTNIALINGATVINHKLQRQMQGWFVTDVNAAATIYRSQPFNSTTLTLTSNAVVVVNLWVY